MLKSSPYYSDVLIVGSGIAGASAALEAANQGLKVNIINKEKDMEESSTRYAQGGIAGLGADDSQELFFEDILNAGDRLGYPEAIKVVVREGPELIERFLVEKINVPFDRDSDGYYDLTREAAHSRRRVYHCKDSTGREIQKRLIQALKNHPNIRLFPEHVAIDLITFPHHSTNPARVYEQDICCGAYVFQMETGEIRPFFARNVVLATGGIGQIYLHTTNPPCATGDGVAMAYRAGAKVINAEYIQFHPTALFSRDEERFLITEAMRGEGAILKNRRGERFMFKYAPELAELAPRDVVARAICDEMAYWGDNYVYLDGTCLIEKGLNIRERFPTIYEKCRDCGLDITRDLIPVVPVAHYFCGGIKVDLWGQTSIQNLYAVGEVSCTGVHGSNRLASVSLLEGLVWGVRAARHIADKATCIPEVDYSEVPSWRLPDVQEEIDPILISQDWLTIKTTMWNYAGIVRTTKRLLRAQADMNYLNHRIMKFYKESVLSRGLIELRNGIIVAQLVIDSALRNTRSSGCHYRRDKE